VLRARLAARYARLAGREITASAGERETLSGKEVWWPGHEGTLHDGLDRETIDERDAVELLAELLDASHGAVDVVAIGPLTNIALLLRRHPGSAARIGHLWVMGGAFDGVRTEHNFRSDAVAAAEVFASGIPTSVIGLEVTETLRITAEQIDHLSSTGPLAQALLDDIEQWRDLWSTAWNVPHDPLVVLALTDPGLFTFSPWGRVWIDTSEGDAAGRAHFVAGPGRTRLITRMATDAVAQLMLDRIATASASRTA
jgi:purine nucleosidase